MESTPPTRSLGTLRARLTEKEPGLYSAEYLDENREQQVAAVSALDAHIATDKEGLINWVESMARQHGYSAVLWE